MGIDGSNLRLGGGMTHLVQLLGAAQPEQSGIARVTVWGARRLLDRLPERRWLVRVNVDELEQAGAARLWWQQVRLTAVARREADVLFCPGGTYLGRFHPFVTMFRNMLPFDDVERREYGYSRMRLKLEALRQAQAATFRRADGVIFLTEHAKAVIGSLAEARGRQAVIPHGIDGRFFRPTVRQPPLEEFSDARPFRWLYVSAIHRYKHPWNVVEAAAMVRGGGIPVSLELVGPAYPPARVRLDESIARLDPDGRFVRVVAEQAHADLPRIYGAADGFVFASTCENLPNALLEAMASGLPIVCSDRAPMPDILGSGGLYCDPEVPSSIAAAMTRMMTNPDLRCECAETAQARARAYRWPRCARATFDLLAVCASSPSKPGYRPDERVDPAGRGHVAS